MTDMDLREELKRLKEENEKLKRNVSANIKVSQKGAVSVYGLQRYPVTLYKAQWKDLFAMQDAIKGFIIEHDKELK
jgi:hypothetical protein